MTAVAGAAPATGVPSPAIVAAAAVLPGGEDIVSAFETVMAGEEPIAVADADGDLRADVAATGRSAGVGVDSIVPSAAPAASPALLPPMDDPATSAVLNALSLRVATEAKGAVDLCAPPPPTRSTSVAAAAGATVLGPGRPAGPVALPADSAPAGAILPVVASPAGLASTVEPQIATGKADTAGIAVRPGPAPGAGDRQAAVPLEASMTLADGGAPDALDALRSRLDAQLARAAPGKAKPLASAAAATPATSPPIATTAPMIAARLPEAAATFAVPEPLAPGAEAGSAAIDPAVAGASPTSASSPAAAGIAAAPLPFAAGPATPGPGPARAEPGQTPIPVPFDSPQWADELATRVSSLAREQIAEAEIRVTPEDLGPIEVKLRFDGERVHAQFGAISPEAREALTANLQRLRELFAGEGLNLGQTFVGHQGDDAARRFGDRQPQPTMSTGAEGQDDPAAGAGASRGTRRGLLDEFA
ncbi:MAG: flagellar hook-length control protein FliK [Pseudomonadota bacterium]